MLDSKRHTKADAAAVGDSVDPKNDERPVRCASRIDVLTAVDPEHAKLRHDTQVICGSDRYVAADSGTEERTGLLLFRTERAARNFRIEIAGRRSVERTREDDSRSGQHSGVDSAT